MAIQEVTNYDFCYATSNESPSQTNAYTMRHPPHHTSLLMRRSEDNAHMLIQISKVIRVETSDDKVTRLGDMLAKRVQGTSMQYRDLLCKDPSKIKSFD